MSILLFLHGLLVLAITLRILLRDDFSPPARLAWFIVLMILPFIGSVVYFLFGENNLGKSSKLRSAQIFGDIYQHATPFLGNAADVTSMIDANYQPVFKYAASINGFQPVSGNTAELMADGDATRQRIVADIDAATDHVHVLYYIWLDDTTGSAVANALIRAVGRGVTCRAMADGLGSRALLKTALWQSMKDAGVQLAVAFPLDTPIRTILTSRLDLRNHRKITIIDGTITYCGSRNSADPEFLVKAKYAPWVDIMARFEGPIVAQNQLLFASDWILSTGEPLDQFPLIAAPVQGGFAAQVIGDGPTERRGATPQLFASAIGCARETVTLSTPYFVPDATVLEALCAAAHRGVSVILIFPKTNDSWIVAAASHSYYRRLLEAGCVIYEFKNGLLHAKTLTIDGKMGMLGSSNLDLRSFDLNYENNILFQDAALTVEIRNRQADYIQQSDTVRLDDVLNWRFSRRIWNNVVATVGPVL